MVKESPGARTMARWTAGPKDNGVSPKPSLWTNSIEGTTGRDIPTLLAPHRDSCIRLGDSGNYRSRSGPFFRDLPNQNTCLAVPVASTRLSR